MNALTTLSKSALVKIRSTRYENPVITKELRTRMRGGKAYFIMAGYVVLLSICLLIAYCSQWAARSFDPQTWGSMKIGMTLFTVLTWCQAILIALIAPSLTSGSITLEREQQTLEMLSLTPLSPRNIVVGKAASAMLYITMLLGSSLPLAGICLMFGSISPAEIVFTYALLAAWAFLFTSTGVFYSSILKKTSAASLAAFGTVLLYGLFVTILSMAIADSYGYRSGSGWAFVFSGLSACLAANNALVMAPVLTAKIPVTAVALAFHLSMAVFLLTVATTRQAYHRAEKPLLIRLWLLGISLASLFALFGNLIGMPQGFSIGSGEMVSFMFIMLCIVIMPVIPIFSTGPHAGKPVLRDVLFGPAARKLFSNRPAGGFWFLLLWFLLGSAVIISVLLLASIGSAGSTAVMEIGRAMEAAGALLAAVMGMAAVGLLASALLPSRQGAVAVTLLAIILAWVVYPIMVAQHDSAGEWQGAAWQGSGGIIWHVAYLWPGVAMDRLTHGWHQGVDSPNLCLPQNSAWIGCIIAWVLFTFVALWIADRRARRGKGVPVE
jgi:ABC-type transport system involved in multi-copper enzyme maturation permease subunit